MVLPRSAGALTMRVSSGELLAQLKQSFEAFGVSQGEYESAAASVLALERWGFEGLRWLETALSRLRTENRPAPQVAYVLDGLVVDCFESSALFGLVPCIERLYVNGWRNAGGQASFKNCREPAFILPSLIRVCERGCSAGMYWWTEGEVNLLHTVRLGSGTESVRVSSGVWASRDVVWPDAKVLITREEKDLESFERDLIQPSFELRERRGSDEHRAFFERSSKSNIEINPWLWDGLQELGREMLVAATVESRMGAGADPRPTEL